MKVRLFALCCILSAAAGCSKEVLTCEESRETVSVDISVPLYGNGGTVYTKATDISKEENVNSLQVFMFRPDGAIEAYGSSDGNKITLDCTVGEKDIVVIVNAPSITDVKTRSQLDGKVSGLKDNSVSALVMYGTASKNVTAASNVFAVPVSRLVARLSIGKITNRIEMPQYRNSTIGIRRIYVVNAAGDMKYDKSSYTPYVWYNKFSCNGDGELPALLCSGTIDGAAIGYGKSYSKPHYFYCYPNPVTEDDEGTDWSPRFTRLVVETVIEGVTYYYPVSIKNIESNHTYNISELVITRLGSGNPDITVSLGAVSFDIEIEEWESGSDETVTI